MKYCTIALYLLFCCSGMKVVAQNTHTLRIITYNVRNGKGLDQLTDYQRIAKVLLNEQPDVVALQELDSVTTRSKGVHVLQELSNITGMYGTYAAAIDFQGGKYGVGVLSKQPPLRVQSFPLPGREERRVLLELVFPEYHLLCTHFSLTESDRLASVRIIDSVIRGTNKPVLLAGDLNDFPQSGLLLQLKTNWQLLSGEANTFPADHPDRCIDYILVHTAHQVRVLQRKVLEAPVASDHRPVLVELVLPQKN